MLLNRFLQKNQDSQKVVGITPDFKQLLDNLSTAIILVDEQLRLIYLNTACEHLLHVSLDHVCGSSISSFYVESDEALSKARQTMEDESLYTKRKACWHLHNGSKITVDYTVTPLKEKRQILFEVQPLDRLLQINREEATLAAQSISRNLIRGLAHEVKNPLGGIRGAAQLLDKEITEIEREDLSEYTNIIISESDRLRSLVDRMMGPNQLIIFQPINIHDVLERVITLINAETGKGIVLKRNYDPSIPEIEGALDLLIQAFLNIIHNAVEALNQSSVVSPEITILTRIRRQFTIGRKHYPLVCSVVVSDNGPGIPDDLIGEIFYPMISGRAEGTGLGLSISQQLINQHNGLIECCSEPGLTQFSVYIPLGIT